MNSDENWELFEPSLTPQERRLREANGILKRLGFTGKQTNESAAYTLLALLDLDPDKSWSEATAPLRGITPIIAFIDKSYGVKYAPNTRETIRDDAVKFFVGHGCWFGTRTIRTDQRTAARPFTKWRTTCSCCCAPSAPRTGK